MTALGAVGRCAYGVGTRNPAGGGRRGIWRSKERKLDLSAAIRGGQSHVTRIIDLIRECSNKFAGCRNHAVLGERAGRFRAGVSRTIAFA
jgi:hypothetical protein